jgi:DNA helicase-2/ATP-dependent DNA helicase PcrA
VEAANTIIDKNKLNQNRFDANDFGPKIKVHRSMTDAEEGRFVAEIFEQKQNQMNNGDFAILYRTPMHNPHAIEKRDIPYRIYGGLSFTKEKK